MADPQHGEHGHEGGGFDHELPLRPILHAGIWTAGVCAFALLAVIPLYHYLAAAERRSDPAASPIAEAAQRQLPPEPRLQPVPELELAALRREQAALLGSYGWADRQAGIARIPIDRAIDLLVERGLTPPAAAPATAAGAGNP